jgi:hypothetical protein
LTALAFNWNAAQAGWEVQIESPRRNTPVRTKLPQPPKSDEMLVNLDFSALAPRAKSVTASEMLLNSNVYVEDGEGKYSQIQTTEKKPDLMLIFRQNTGVPTDCAYANNAGFIFDKSANPQRLTVHLGVEDRVLIGRSGCLVIGNYFKILEAFR